MGSEGTGTTDPAETECFDRDPDGSPRSIHTHPDGADEISSGVIEDAGKSAEPAGDEPDTERRHEAPAVPREHPRRLVPDFVPSPVEPPQSLCQRSEELPEEHGTRARLKKWLPLIAALLLVGGMVWFLSHPGPQGAANSTTAPTAETVRPLGLYVDPAGPAWRVLWNPNATALHDARSVQLFVREREDQNQDDQNRIDLSPRDLASGSYEYKPGGDDVTFRLEVTDRAGQVSAESFRLMRAANPPAAPNAAPPARITQPRAIYRAPPVVAAGIRPRIKGTIPIDVRVHIDTRGHVVSATPATKQHSGFEEYLATRAVQAARLWRFEPARENGKAVAGTQTIHFVFEK